MNVETYAWLLARTHRSEFEAVLGDRGLTRAAWEEHAEAWHRRLSDDADAGRPEELGVFARVYREERQRLETSLGEISVDETSAFVFDRGAPLPFVDHGGGVPLPDRTATAPHDAAGATQELRVDQLDLTLPFSFDADD